MQTHQALDPLELECQMVVKHLVTGGNWTQIPVTAISALNSEPSLQPPFSCLLIAIFPLKMEFVVLNVA